MINTVAELIHADGCSRPQNSGNRRSTERKNQSVADRAQCFRIFKKLFVPVEGKPGKNGKAFAGIEGEHKQNGNRREEKNHDKSGINFRCGFHFSPPSLKQRNACSPCAAETPCKPAE